MKLKDVNEKWNNERKIIKQMFGIHFRSQEIESDNLACLNSIVNKILYYSNVGS